jgi:hypothetical protein
MTDKEIIKKADEIINKRRQLIHDLLFNRDITINMGGEIESFRIVDFSIDPVELNGSIACIKHVNKEPTQVSIVFTPKNDIA